MKNKREKKKMIEVERKERSGEERIREKKRREAE